MHSESVDSGEEAGSPRGDRASLLLWVLGAVVVLILVVGAVAGALREPSQLDPDTPEGVTQAYLQAVFDHRFDDAQAHLSPAAAAQCSAADFRQAWVPESLSATLDEVRTDGEEAEVSVRLRTPAGPEPFGGSHYANRETFSLTAGEGGTWRLTGEPWPLPPCGRR